eukprot:5350000-Alexandrium_andersonii.AAC.1
MDVIQSLGMAIDFSERTCMFRHISEDHVYELEQLPSRHLTIDISPLHVWTVIPPPSAPRSDVPSINMSAAFSQ